MTVLPDNVLTKMSPEDRRKIGQMTSGEADAKYTARLEKELHNQIINHLNRRGIDYIHAPMHKKSPLPKGWSDFTIVLKYEVVFFECKIPPNKLDPDQLRHKVRMEALGFRHFVITDYAQAVEVIDRKEREMK